MECFINKWVVYVFLMLYYENMKLLLYLIIFVSTYFNVIIHIKAQLEPDDYDSYEDFEERYN